MARISVRMDTEIEWSISTAELDCTWFASDPHFDHLNIIQYCDRPFKTVEEMNSTILANWNNAIGPEHMVIFLGDMAFGRRSRPPRWWLRFLNGRKLYLKGSHDKGIRPTSQFDDDQKVIAVVDAVILDLAGIPAYCMHEPYGIPWEWKDCWKIHGHRHNNVPMVQAEGKYLNLSMDVTGFKPVSAREVHSIIQKYNKEEAFKK